MKAETLVIYVAWSALAGALIPVMAALQGAMGRSLQSPFHASLIGVGIAFVTVGIVFAVMRPAMPSGELFAAAPKLAWFAGMAMAFYALTVTFVTPKFGVGNVVMCVVVAQLVMSSLIDQFGLFGAPVHGVDLKRAAGLALLAGGAALVAIK
jgi:transporter family-2 protein